MLKFRVKVTASRTYLFGNETIEENIDTDNILAFYIDDVNHVENITVSKINKNNNSEEAIGQFKSGQAFLIPLISLSAVFAKSNTEGSAFVTCTISANGEHT